MAGTEHRRPTRRGRVPRHTRGEVVAAGVRRADADGLAAVTMRGVAAELGTSVMALYAYVPDKRALVFAMLDHVFAQVAYPPLSGDWRADLHLLARTQRDAMLRHPWVVDAVSVAQPPGPALLAYVEFALGALEPLGRERGRDPDQDTAWRLETAALLTGSVVNLVRAELQRRGAARAPAPDPAALQALLASGRYPRVAAAFAAAPLRHVDSGAEFDRLVDRFLDGLAAGA
jgi:AcrR family transcriptional regulator